MIYKQASVIIHDHRWKRTVNLLFNGYIETADKIQLQADFKESVPLKSAKFW